MSIIEQEKLLKKDLKLHLLYFLVDNCSGKSYVMKAMAEAANKKGNHVLILAHRISLINQHKELFDDIDWNLTRIESVFTEVRHLGENGPVDLIIIDEAHLAMASSYVKVCEYYDCPRVGYTRFTFTS
jgi:superfamily II DNA or RNA helicase